ncbi:kinesin-like protein KIF25 isoform X3 [Choloepus didactylus]|uniref:kinesin-like protein KIF25 isoform X3 n=1 Tax=Choloepus didactylus TaxID=27675 RepID=UPI0018A03648|nr:kinesin-like protein KIF25 isoform X3 [Choloepus didactylus]
MPARGAKWGRVADQRVQQLQHQVRVKEERIVELETENSILHLKLAEYQEMIGKSNREATRFYFLYNEKQYLQRNIHSTLIKLYQVIQKLKQDIKEFHSSCLELIRNYQDQYRVCLSEIVTAVHRTQLYNEALQSHQSRAVHLEKCLQEINEQYQIEKQKRKLLHNSLVETVLVKCNRPGHPLINKTYNFERVYGPAESQRTVFGEIRPLLMSLLDGYNVCIMAYGQTGSGKSYTMLGPHLPDDPALSLDSHGDLGIIPRAAEELFRLISENPSRSPEVEVSIVEIYNNEIFDLLAKDSCTLVSGVKRDVITTKEGKKELSRLTYKSVSSAVALMGLVAGGLRLRVKHPTLVHTDSSRSHLVITVTLTAASPPDSSHQQPNPMLKELICPSAPRTAGGEGPRASRRASSPGAGPVGAAGPPRQAQARLQLVDLAGSECVGASGVTGLALRETSCINRSLAALADVLGALAERRGHVPYRNSRLTHFLQDSIGGDAKLLVMLCVSPCQKHLAETLQCLGFGSRARQVQRGQAKRGVPASGKSK